MADIRRDLGVPELFSLGYSGEMSTKHVRTAADLVRFGCALKVECRGCGHALTMEGYELVREVGKLPLKQLEARLRCSRCGKRQVRTALLSPPPKR